MKNNSHKKGLRLKIGLVTILGILIPILTIFFIHTNPLVSILIGIGICLLVQIILFWILKPLDNLHSGIETLGEGNLNFRLDIRSNDEFEEIGNSFNLVAEKLNQDYQKLEGERDAVSAQKSRLDVILSSVIDGIIAIDFNKNIMVLNKAAEELTGYTASEVYGKPIDQIIHLFSDQEEIFPKTYCQGNFNQPAKIIGKGARQTKINLMTAQISGKVQTNLNCILILHDLSKEEELEQMKFDFVSMASHELKTPLTSIIGYLSVFLNEYHSNRNTLPKEDLELLDRSLISAQQLLNLVQNLLNVNKIEREQMSVSIEPIDYLPILTKAVDDLKSHAGEKNITLTLATPQLPLPKVSADAIRIGEVITNLVANAINYTDAGGRISVNIKVSPNELTTTVSDTGVGIPKEAIPHLFNKFFRVSNQLQKGSKGTGLGLYISKSIIEKLNGKIWVESEVGVGSNFSFTLPITTVANRLIDTNRFISADIQTGNLSY